MDTWYFMAKKFLATFGQIRGILILTMPNNNPLRSYFSLIFKNHFVAFLDTCYPTHIAAILEKDLIRICKEIG